ncbi:MAG: prepilin peptidase [Candidatus Aminicenantes bacterium]|nr:prepilin peptidase [Candidatus Aminicenantes bacterium]
MEEALTVILGLIVGSFLNVVICRMPQGKSVVLPASHCPRCDAAIPFYDNVPLLSYALLRGRCRSCRGRISPRYPLIEALVALGFWLSHHSFGLTLHAAASAAFLSLLIALAAIDLEHMVLPDELTLGGALLFLAYAFVHPGIKWWEAVSSGLGGALFFALLYVFYLKVRKIEGLGFGDVKMALMMGLFLGLRRLVVAVMLASFSGLLVGLFFIVFRKKNLKLALPFGPFLALGSAVSLFCGEAILAWIATLWIRA